VGAAALIAAVGLAASYILQDMPALDPVVRLSRLSLRYREARRDLAARLGRALTATEQVALADAYKLAVRRERFRTQTEASRSVK
jgi:hypothetical protein